MGDIFIRGLILPITVKGATVLDENGDYNVYINLLLSRDTQIKTKKHELKHIQKEHFHNFNPVVFDELEANQ
jgi:hypothetical protein